MTVETASTRRGDAAVVRRIWRLHFWVGLFVAPVLMVLACSGLIILYSQPLDRWLNGNLLVVAETSRTVPLDEQVALATERAGEGYVLDAVIPPPAPDRSTRVDFAAADASGGETNVLQVFVDPYTGAYLGARDQLSGLVGWANQVHRMFGNDAPQLRLPSLGHLIAPGAYPEATLSVGVGNVLMEIAAVWVLVLVASGVFLWWPRAVEAAKPLLRVRWRRGGRVRWRDVHALTGVVLAVVVGGYVLSGLTWSRYWGENWRALSATVAPSVSVDAPSTPATMGDRDRLGRRIARAAADDPVYASAPAGPTARPISLADVERIAGQEGMVAGYAIIPPSNSVVDGAPVWGSYTVVNAWPQRLSEQRTLYLDQFTGETITNATSAQDGALTRLTSFGIAVHMGNQYGVLTRITATAVCIGVFLSVTTGFLMWWKRRPTGGTGLPAPSDGETVDATPRRAVVTVVAAAGVMGVLFPTFGATLLVVLAVELVVARRRRRDLPDGDTRLAESVDSVGGRHG